MSFALAYIQTSLFSLTCERQTKRIRQQLVCSLLHKDIFYFDTHTTGELMTILNRYLDDY